MKKLMFHTHLHTHGYTQGFFAELDCLGVLIEFAINCLILLCFSRVPRAGLEPAQTQCLQDFKSSFCPKNPRFVGRIGGKTLQNPATPHSKTTLTATPFFYSFLPHGYSLSAKVNISFNPVSINNN